MNSFSSLCFGLHGNLFLFVPDHFEAEILVLVHSIYTQYIGIVL